MSFKQKSFLNKTEIKKAISDLLREKITTLQIAFQGKGSSGNVNNVSVVTEGGKSKDFILKKQDDYPYLNLYKQILNPLKLNHPIVLGSINLKDGGFLVIEYIEHDRGAWTEEMYMKAVRWLKRKDKIIQQNLYSVANNPLILKKQNYLDCLIEKHIKVIKSGIRQKVHPKLNDGLIDVIKFNQNKYSETIKQLKRDPVTLCHYDFCESNVLISNKEIHVIDWTGPFVASPCIDLVEILKNTNSALERKIVKGYEKDTNIPDFKKLYRATKKLNDLSYFSWVIKKALKKDLFLENDTDFTNLADRVLS